MSGDNATVVRVLILEDNLDDVELELYQLRQAGFSVEHMVARNRKELLAALPSFHADIILADYSLPDITGIEAIGLCRELGIDLPVILITGEGNEMIAVDSLRHGAIDYLLKRNISGLGPRVRRALEIWKDRKARLRAEEEEARLQHLLFESQKMDAIGRLAGGIAHDFNNILTGIIGFADICLHEAVPDSPMSSRLQSIISFSEKGADLVRQLLIFSRKMSMDFEKTEFNGFVRDVAAFLKRIVEETIEIRLQLSPDQLFVLCDRGQFTQVLMNLVLNARDAMDGRGIITIRTESCSPDDELLLAAGESVERSICLSVSDTGPGIDEADIPNIFDPFFTTKDLGKGTGLGLSIVYSVVKSHRGVVRAVNAAGGGAVFRIFLPAAAADIPVMEGSPFYETIPQERRRCRGGSETILVAEDEEVIRELLATYLRSCGYTVVTARDGEEALDVYRAGSRKIDLVLSDMRMPNRSGLELFREVRSLSPHAPFILMTGYSLADQDETVLKRIDSVLTKPFVPARVAEEVRTVLDRKRS